MAKFDAETFAGAVVQPLRLALETGMKYSAVAEENPRRADLALAVAQLERDIRETLRALEILTDERILVLIQKDVEQTFPARRMALESAWANLLGKDHEAVAQVALQGVVTAAVAAAKAFLL